MVAKQSPVQIVILILRPKAREKAANIISFSKFPKFEQPHYFGLASINLTETKRIIFDNSVVPF